jgi:hypothetical protein
MIILITDEKYSELNQVYAMDISDKIKSSHSSCKNACRTILFVINS